MAPGLSWDAIFKFTLTEIDLISDVVMICDFEKGNRGGMNFVNKHIVEANYPEMTDFDSMNPQRYLMLCTLLQI